MARSLLAKVALVSSARVAAVAFADAGERRPAIRLLFALDEATRDPQPRFRRFVDAQIRLVETALDLPHAGDTEAVEVVA